MKVFLLALLFFIATGLLAQPLNSGINFNSTYTVLGNGATWTGTAEQLHNNFSFACVTVYSNKSGTLKVAQSRDGVRWRSYYKFSYTANDTVANKFWTPIQLPWIRVSYTNASGGAQGTFELTTSYMLSNSLPTDSTGHILTAGGGGGGSTTISNFPAGTSLDSNRVIDRATLQTYSSTVLANDSVGSIISLGYHQLPSAFWTTDSLKNKTDSTKASYKYLKFYVFVGDTTGKAALSNWSLISLTDSGTVIYTAKLARKVFTSVSPTVFYSLLADPSITAKKVYLRPYVVGGLNKPIAIKIKTRNY